MSPALLRVRSRLSDDRGASLIELVVGMMILTIFLGMFTGAILMMNSAENKAESVNVTSTQISQVFTRLDKIVRYAAAVSTPARSATSTDWYVEMRTTNTGEEICTQLRIDVTTGQLQRRTWTVVNASASGLSSWSQVAPGITNGDAAAGSADQPFVLNSQASSVPFQQLTINLVSTYGSGPTQTTSRSSFTTNAVNSTVPPPASICQEAGQP
jgi:hypothetical protein